VSRLLRIDDLRNRCQDENIAITKHAKIRLAERSITVEDIKNAVKTGEIIEQYEDDKPFPSCLLLGSSQQDTHIHVVASVDNGYLYVITAYRPDENDWEADLKTKKERPI
jgi:hypothetical protein